jgi:hypothetical protein
MRRAPPATVRPGHGAPGRWRRDCGTQRSRGNRLEFRLLDVLRDVDYDGARAAAAGEVEGFLEDPGQVVYVGDQVGVLHDRQRHAVEVGLLERTLADVLLKNLTGDRDDGRRVHVGVGDGADEVGGAGAAGRHTHADPAGGTGVAFGGEGAALFVTGEDDADLVRAGEGLVQLLGCAAGVGENDIDRLADEALDDSVSTLHFSGRFRPWETQRERSWFS